MCYVYNNGKKGDKIMKKFIVILVIVALLTLLIVLFRHTTGTTITIDDLCCPANPVNQMLHVVGLL